MWTGCSPALCRSSREEAVGASQTVFHVFLSELHLPLGRESVEPLLVASCIGAALLSTGHSFLELAGIFFCYPLLVWTSPLFRFFLWPVSFGNFHHVLEVLLNMTRGLTSPLKLLYSPKCLDLFFLAQLERGGRWTLSPFRHDNLCDWLCFCLLANEAFRASLAVSFVFCLLSYDDVLFACILQIGKQILL